MRIKFYFLSIIGVLMVFLAASCENEPLELTENPQTENPQTENPENEDPDIDQEEEDEEDESEEDNQDEEEEEEEEESADLLLGAWDVVQANASGTIETQVFGQTISGPFTAENTDTNYQITFNEDNSVESTGTITLAVSYELAGQTFTENIVVDAQDENGMLLSGTYARDENTLTITNETGTETAEIIELDETTLVLLTNFSRTEIIDGQEYNVTGTIEMVLMQEN